MNSEVAARRMPQSMRAVMIAHLDAIFPLHGDLRKPRSSAFTQSANALIALGYLKINLQEGPSRTALTEKGRMMLGAILAIMADDAAPYLPPEPYVRPNFTGFARFSGPENVLRLVHLKLSTR